MTEYLLSVFKELKALPPYLKKLRWEEFKKEHQESILNTTSPRDGLTAVEHSQVAGNG